MTTLAGSKIRKFREERSLTRAAFGAWYDTPGSTVQGWEEEGKRASSVIVNQIAANGIATHADWYVHVRDQDKQLFPIGRLDARIGANRRQDLVGFLSGRALRHVAFSEANWGVHS